MNTSKTEELTKLLTAIHEIVESMSEEEIKDAGYLFEDMEALAYSKMNYPNNL